MCNETLCDFPIPQDHRVYIFEDVDAMGEMVSTRAAVESGGNGRHQSHAGDSSSTSDDGDDGEQPMINCYTKQKRQSKYSI